MSTFTRFIFPFLVAALVVTVTNSRYSDYIRDRNFPLTVNTLCDVSIEPCFISDCSPDEPDCDTEPYKKVEILRRDAPKCLEEHNCSSFVCPFDAQDCSVSVCDSQSVEEGEKCYETGVTVE